MNRAVPFRGFLGLAGTAIVLDLVVPALADIRWRRFEDADKTPFLAPEDDLGYALSGTLYALSFLLRYVVLAVLVGSLVGRTARARTGPRHGGWIALALVLCEFGGASLIWTRSDPSASWCVAVAATCTVSALVSAALVVSIRRAPRPTQVAGYPQQRQHGWPAGSA